MSTPPPTHEQRVIFLQQVQRILTEGSFVATYKFALLHALADLARSEGDSSGDELPLQTRQIAEKFIELYWRQVVPFGAKQEVLRQNTGSKATVIGAIETVRSCYGGSLARAKRSPDWPELVKRVNSNIRQMPLWKLQTVGGGAVLDFLYPVIKRRATITLKPGVAYCLRSFYGLLTDLFRGAWLRHVRRINEKALGPSADLAEHLFGGEREDLSKEREILRKVQDNTCLYCQGRVRSGGDVDHFIPWVLHPTNLGHNLVLAHRSCNGRKSDRLAALPHLERWCQRNEEHGEILATEFDGDGILHYLGTTRRIAAWAYERTEAVDGHVWLSDQKVLVPLGPSWRSLLAS